MDLERIKNGLQNRAMKYINERRGWRTNRKIVVIESDDWGSIRMPNKKVYDKMLASGLRVDKCNYCKYDTLASKDDFEQLYKVLIKHTDSKGNHPIITANTIVANPNFEEIRKNNFKEYFYEPFTETLKKYPNHSFGSWQEGIDSKLFFPQFHGREHLNVARWMLALQNESKEVCRAFNNKFFGISKTISNENNPSFMAAMDTDNIASQEIVNNSIREGLKMFEEIFGYKSESFIAPNYVWNKEVEDVLFEENIKYLQGGYIQKVPQKGSNYNYTGKRNKNNQIYLTRNVLFEPSMLADKDWVNTSLLEIEKSFKHQKPAIICSHRVNFIGGVFEENRTKTLKLLDELLFKSLKKWPSIEFMTSVELGDLIKNGEL